jgi:hypothetical protein
MSFTPQASRNISYRLPPKHFLIFTMKYTLLVAIFFGMAMAGPSVLTAEDVFGLEKRACEAGLRYTNHAVCRSTGCKICVPNYTCDVSVQYI